MSTTAVEASTGVPESTPPIQQSTPPPELAKTEPKASTTRMASKRKRAASTTSHNSDTAPRKVQKKAGATTLALTDPTKQYGVFQHRYSLDTSGLNADLIHSAPTFTAARSHLLALAGALISDHAEWGACSTHTTDNTFEIHDYDGNLRAKFDIDTVRSTADGDWVREEVWLASHWAERPTEHYGMFIKVDPDKSSLHGDHYVGGYASLGEASAAMKASALAHLATHPSSRLFERSIEVVDAEGKVVQRYLVAKGREIGGKFVCEEEWVRKEKALSDGDEDALQALDSDEAEKRGIMRLPTPPPAEEDAEGEEMTIAPGEIQEVQPAQPAQEPQQQQPGPDQEPQQPAAQPTQPQAPAPALEDDGVECWCTCHQPDTGELMIGCDNDDCPIQWYHGRCIGLDEAPEGDWLCPTCSPDDEPAATKGKGTAKGKGKGGKATKKTAAKAPAKGKGGKGRKK